LDAPQAESNWVRIRLSQVEPISCRVKLCSPQVELSWAYIMPNQVGPTFGRVKLGPCRTKYCWVHIGSSRIILRWAKLNRANFWLSHVGPTMVEYTQLTLGLVELCKY